MAEINIFNTAKLWEMAKDPDAEFRLEGNELHSKQGTWHGRAAREIKTILGEDRVAKNAAYRGAHERVLHSLQAIYGERVGEKAFRAGFGRPGADGAWQTNESAPITGRHIRRMLVTAERELEHNRGIVAWIGATRDDGMQTADELLGEKVSQPRQNVHVSEVYGDIANDLEADRLLRMQVDNPPKHCFWVLDLKGHDFPGERIAIHVDGDDPEMIEIRTEARGEWGGPSEVRQIHKDEFAVELRRLMDVHFGGSGFSSGGVKEMALYRTMDIPLDEWLQRKRAEVEQAGLADVDNGVKSWANKVLDGIERNANTLKNQRFDEVTHEDDALQIDGNEVIHEKETIPDNRVAVFVEFVNEQLEVLGVADENLRTTAINALCELEEAYLAEPVPEDRMEAFTHRESRLKALRESMVQKLAEVLAEGPDDENEVLAVDLANEETRNSICRHFGDALGGWLAQVSNPDTEKFTSIRDRKDRLYQLCVDLAGTYTTYARKVQAKQHPEVPDETVVVEWIDKPSEDEVSDEDF